MKAAVCYTGSIKTEQIIFTGSDANMVLKPIYDNKQSIDGGKPFMPRALKSSDFSGAGISSYIVEKAVLGSELFSRRYEDGTLFPKMVCSLAKADVDGELLVHNYTGQCPAQTFEINPVKGCNVGCAYCLVNDGVHETPVVYMNYHKLVEKRLEKHRHEKHYFYYSPKTEAFSEATLQTGIAHNILRAFIGHFEKYPDSNARLFIASKSGAEALRYEHGGDSILDLFIKLKGKMQFNTSLSIFPSGAIKLIEPYSADIRSRLEAVKLCQENGIMADSALVQPILISILTEELLENFFKLLSSYNIVNFKPEFLTVCVENMTLMAQILETYDKDILIKAFETYFQSENLDHIKQRGRTAPSRERSIFWISKMKETASRYGISISICHWVREQLKISEGDIPKINANGFQCLGYQTKLL